MCPAVGRQPAQRRVDRINVRLCRLVGVRRWWVGRALTWAHRAVDRLPESSEAALALATAQEATGDLSSALNTYQRLQALSPTNALVWQRQGVVQAETGAFPAAETSLLKAANLSPTSSEPWQNLATLYGLMNRPEDQAAALQRAKGLSE